MEVGGEESGLLETRPAEEEEGGREGTARLEAAGWRPVKGDCEALLAEREVIVETGPGGRRDMKRRQWC